MDNIYTPTTTSDAYNILTDEKATKVGYDVLRWIVTNQLRPLRCCIVHLCHGAGRHCVMVPAATTAMTKLTVTMTPDNDACNVSSNTFQSVL